MVNLFSVLLNTIKAKINPIWTKIKLWTNWQFIQTRVITKIRIFFTKSLTIKPRHKKDYYAIFGWLVSKRLVVAIVMGIGVFSLYYLCFVNPLSVFKGSGDAIRTYSYHSIPLRFTKGEVKIKAKSGYIAYEGNVESGQVTGAGNLYNQAGEVVYTGAFEANKFNGMGKEYYPGQVLKYTGNFADNLYEEEGILYRKNGTKEYEGTFSLGMKEGEGILYDSSNNQVYTGNFSKDQLLYSDLLGQKTAEIAKSYTGARTVYTDDTNFVVLLEDIHALYTGNAKENALDDSMGVEGVYVLSPKITRAGKECTNIAELNEVFQAPMYEGNSSVIMPEAVAIQALNNRGDKRFEMVDMQTENEFEDVIRVVDYESDYLIYLYSYEYEDLIYTFFTKEKYGEFSMYLIESAKSNSKE